MIYDTSSNCCPREVDRLISLFFRLIKSRIPLYAIDRYATDDINSIGTLPDQKVAIWSVINRGLHITPGNLCHNPPGTVAHACPVPDTKRYIDKCSGR